MRLGYTTANASLNATAKYNGNIAWIEWRAGAYCVPGGVARYKSGYGFTYDGLDRMTASKYGEYLSPSWTNFDRYNENLTYDASGNILTLNRRGYISAGNYNVIDNLTYTMDATNSNRVSSVADASGSTLGFPAASGAYTYDSNGNQISDGAKGFTAITYNHLNLPTKFTQGANTIEIQYDASGRKLKKILSGGTTKSYIGSFEYVGTTVEAVYHSEGRARNNSGTFVYEYVIKDHLGNSRVMFTNTSGAIAQIQENHYYPFGLEQAGWIANPTPPHAYKYNGKELNVDFGLNLSDYGARWYDPGLGRWMSVDPLSEKMRRYSPYNYGFNNPMKFIDPDGREPEPVNPIKKFFTDVKEQGVIKAISNYFNFSSFVTGDKEQQAQTLNRVNSANSTIIASLDRVDKKLEKIENGSDYTTKAALTTTALSGGLAAPITEPIAVVSEFTDLGAKLGRTAIEYIKDGNTTNSGRSLFAKGVSFGFGIASDRFVKGLKITGTRFPAHATQTSSAVGAMGGLVGETIEDAIEKKK
ncbi:MAG: RHS repeat-associated core domain-containing protein [Saprospiraceae bacterium]|nr:RHS repeat-associated core domain-containing protein [Saprospiraceae bacterium]